ncbi:GNAT family N-acetyltransferase [Phenylobacterium sp. J426]|uniref:GNAT family N-acetyltransferase n=1 Tax=Phenylobacterium sp. J426 TaxID=2898439 RepID=UPI002150E55B|nr:GNAT family protein [Phenylobacterium sp. J426]MCR5874301.1 GNAT family N-acetyltransferase [Phenylobacterium sp. J426]
MSTPIHLAPQVLENRFVRLEPLAERHRGDLQQACWADPDLWTQLYSFSMLPEQFDATWDTLLAGTLGGRSLTYAVTQGGRCVGMTSFLAIDAASRTVEVGGTYYAPQARGGAVNPAAKRLMMAQAFEAGMNRVQYCVDALNARSRAAVLKLGAVQEGVLRAQKITWTGRVRDTVVFSILADEWPAARARLDARLAAFT